MNVFELTHKLISIPSISGDEKPVALFLAEYLSHIGFDEARCDCVYSDAARRHFLRE